uniref:Uncharacterized protein n=1 Tax=Anguilla anguilla TaxID=7936 RepID=A0A0E9PY42_ANGAN
MSVPGSFPSPCFVMAASCYLMLRQVDVQWRYPGAWSSLQFP